MQRRAATIDISQLLQWRKLDSIDLDPPYQRRSVWTPKDRRFFLDTIFKGYPCPALYLHKDFADESKEIYRVVDGKQRIETIFHYVDGRIKLGDYNDAELDGKKWNQLTQTQRQTFWNYVLPVEYLTGPAEPAMIDSAFERLNRNARRLERQELRHAKYSGWFATFVEMESENADWATLKVVTTARAKRMKDVQFLSELLLVTITKELSGFDQNALDDAYATYDDEEEGLTAEPVESVLVRWNSAKSYLMKMEETNECISKFAYTFHLFYSIWGWVTLASNKPEPGVAAISFVDFINRVNRISEATPGEYQAALRSSGITPEVISFHQNSTGANTERPQRIARHAALEKSIADWM